MPIGILLTIGKYLFVALLYLFVFLAFRALMAQALGARRRRNSVSAHRVRREAATPGGQPTGLTSEQAQDSQPVAPPTSQGPQAALVVYRSTETALSLGRRYPLAATVTMGRGPHNTIVLTDRYASQDHAVVYFENGRHLLSDHHSTNGTYHNDVRITEPVVLANGDEICIGTTAFTYQAAG